MDTIESIGLDCQFKPSTPLGECDRGFRCGFWSWSRVSAFFSSGGTYIGYIFLYDNLNILLDVFEKVSCFLAGQFGSNFGSIKWIVGLHLGPQAVRIVSFQQGGEGLQVTPRRRSFPGISTVFTKVYNFERQEVLCAIALAYWQVSPGPF